MYSLNCDYFVEEFSSIEKLLYYVEQVGMDPNYEITRNGKCTGEYLSELISYWFMVVFLLLVFWVLLVVDERESSTEINED